MNHEQRKEIGISAGIALLVATGILGLTWSYYLLPPAIALSIGVGGLLVSIALLAVGKSLARHVESQLLLSLIPGLAIIIAGKVTPSSILGGILGAVVLVSAGQHIRREMEGRLHFRPYQIFRGGVRGIAYGAIIALLGLAYPALMAAATPASVEIKSQQVEFVTRPLEPVIRNLLPNYQSESTLDTLIDQQIAAQAPPGTTITPEERVLIRQQIAGRVGVEHLAGNENLAAIVTQILNRYLDFLLSYNRALVPILVLVVALLTLRLFLPLVVLPTLLIIVGALKAARALGLVKMTTVTTVVERLTY